MWRGLACPYSALMMWLPFNSSRGRRFAVSLPSPPLISNRLCSASGDYRSFQKLFLSVLIFFFLSPASCSVKSTCLCIKREPAVNKLHILPRLVYWQCMQICWTETKCSTYVRCIDNEGLWVWWLGPDKDPLKYFHGFLESAKTQFSGVCQLPHKGECFLNKLPISRVSMGYIIL